MKGKERCPLDTFGLVLRVLFPCACWLTELGLRLEDVFHTYAPPEGVLQSQWWLTELGSRLEDAFHVYAPPEGVPWARRWLSRHCRIPYWRRSNVSAQV